MTETRVELENKGQRQKGKRNQYEKVRQQNM